MHTNVNASASAYANASADDNAGANRNASSDGNADTRASAVVNDNAHAMPALDFHVSSDPDANINAKWGAGLTSPPDKVASLLLLATLHTDNFCKWRGLDPNFLYRNS